MSRKNGKKLLIAITVGAVVVKAVRDVRKAKKQEEEFRSALDDFYEEELNWWDREIEEGGTPCRRKQHRKPLLLQSRLPS